MALENLINEMRLPRQLHNTEEKKSFDIFNIIHRLELAVYALSLSLRYYNLLYLSWLLGFLMTFVIIRTDSSL